MTVAVAISLACALFLAVGFVVQQHAAAQEPPSERLSPKLLVKLAQRPLWLGGVGAMVIGQLLGAVALGRADIALVEPLMAMNLLFALPLSAVWHRMHLGPREWAGAVLLLLGLVGFIVAGNPHGGTTTRLPWPNWVMAGGSIILVSAVLVSISRRFTTDLQATLLASAAGALYGLQDALTQRTMVGFSHGVVAELASWPVFSLLAVAIVAMLLGQSAFEEAPLAASLPAITVLEPITGIAFGVGVYREHLSLSPPRLAFELAGLVAMVVGVILVARSPIVTGGTRVCEREREVERVG